jgi:hypothetical protein
MAFFIVTAVETSNLTKQSFLFTRVPTGPYTEPEKSGPYLYIFFF